MVRKITLCCILAFVASCASQQKESAPTASPSTTEDTVSDGPVDRDDAVAGKRAEEETVNTGVVPLVTATNEFAFDLLKVVPDGNMVMSPYGAASMLTLVLAGTEAETSAELRTALHLRGKEGDMHDQFRRLHDQLRLREQNEDHERGFRIRAINGIWHSPKTAILPAFRRVAEREHLAQIETVDFDAVPETHAKISKFFDDATAGRIVDVVPPRAIDQSTRLVVANATYFDAAWDDRFHPASTTLLAFETPDGSVEVPTMRGTQHVRHFANDKVHAVALPYVGGDVEAIVLVPQSGDADAFAQGLDVRYYEWIVQQMEHTDVAIHLPRFSIGSELDFPTAMGALGVRRLFDAETAQLGRLSSAPETLYVNSMVHNATMEIDEEGTVAAAGSAAIMGALGSGGGSQPVEFRADRPFLIVVRDVPTGAILFIARVVRP